MQTPGNRPNYLKCYRQKSHWGAAIAPQHHKYSPKLPPNSFLTRPSCQFVCSFGMFGIHICPFSEIASGTHDTPKCFIRSLQISGKSATWKKNTKMNHQIHSRMVIFPHSSCLDCLPRIVLQFLFSPANRHLSMSSLSSRAVL